MAQVILSSVDRAIGGPIGGFIGSTIGRAIDHSLISSLAPARQVGPRLDSLHIQSTGEGSPLPAVVGRARISGQVLWAARFTEARVAAETGGGKGGPKAYQYDYSLSFAVGLCEGPIDGIGRIWADGKPLDQTGVTMRVYLGADDQTPDPLIEAVEGEAPAYRGLAYVVFEDLPLAAFGNRPPQLSFEVFRRPKPAGAPPALEDLLTSVCLIPGAGEFVYATEPVLRRLSISRTAAE
ncbi:MAG: baseplate multidomain protein megatron, partial [Caulobacteraceae bacterium]